MKKPAVNPSEHKCPECMGAGYVVAKHPTRAGVKTYTVCKECKGKGRVATNCGYLLKKFIEASPLSDPETAARKPVEIASGIEAVQDGRIHIEKINGPFLFEIKGTPEQYKAGR